MNLLDIVDIACNLYQVRHGFNPRLVDQPAAPCLPRQSFPSSTALTSPEEPPNGFCSPSTLQNLWIGHRSRARYWAFQRCPFVPSPRTRIESLIGGYPPLPLFFFFLLSLQAHTPCAWLHFYISNTITIVFSFDAVQTELGQWTAKAYKFLWDHYSHSIPNHTKQDQHHQVQHPWPVNPQSLEIPSGIVSPEDEEEPVQPPPVQIHWQVWPKYNIFLFLLFVWMAAKK